MLHIEAASSAVAAAMVAFHRILQLFYSVPPSQSAMENLSTPSSEITIAPSLLPHHHHHHHQQTWSKSSHLVEKPLKVQSLFLLLLLLLLVLATNTAVQCRSHRVSFDLQELAHDSPVVDPEKVVQLELRRGESLEYVLDAYLLPNQTLRLYLAKPYKVRKVEALDNLEPLVMVYNDHHRTPYVRFSKGNANHRGYYHLYSFVYDLEGRLVNYDRIDFHVSVVGLFPEMHQRISDDQCDSGHSMLGFCVCRQAYPVYKNNICLPARDQNETCEIDQQCQEFGGVRAECYTPFGKCRCQQGTVPVKISRDLRTCVPAAQLRASCLYSMQCSLEGENRFCNEHYRCECLPGHSLEDGRYCSSGMGHQSLGQKVSTATLLLVLLAFTTLIVYL